VKTLESLVLEAKGIVKKYHEGTASAEELERLPQVQAEIRSAQKAEADVQAGEELLRGLALGAKSADKGDPNDREEKAARSLGEHLIRTVKASGLKAGMGQFQPVTTPEFKAATDVLTTETGLVSQDVQQRVVSGEAWVPTIASLFAQGTVSGTGIKYFQETPIEGDFAAVAENGLKPQLSMGYSPVTEGLSKIAGFIKESDEFLEDLPFLASVTNGRLLRRLAQREEDMLLNGSGTDPELRGLLNRTGLQTTASANRTDNLNALFRAAMAVQTVTGLVADGIVINPADYQNLRLSQDANGQYLAGGPFQGAYGNAGGVVFQPPIWGIRTVVSAAVPVGTALVGAFGTAGMVFRKGGVRVEIANQNEADFIHNRVTLRAEERLGLAVYVPAGFNRVTLSSAAPA
jgi:HK97 family phage major capsid protein